MVVFAMWYAEPSMRTVTMCEHGVSIMCRSSKGPESPLRPHPASDARPAAEGENDGKDKEAA